MTVSWKKGKRVAIVGAGPGGVSAALEFIAQGFDVRLAHATNPKEWNTSTITWNLPASWAVGFIWHQNP